MVFELSMINIKKVWKHGETNNRSGTGRRPVNREKKKSRLLTFLQLIRVGDERKN
jgi:hypothetical protein